MAVRVGGWEISRIEEAVLAEASSLFAEWRPGTAAELAGAELAGAGLAEAGLAEAGLGETGPAFYDPGTDSFVASMHGWLLRRPGSVILIDTGVGNDKPRPASPRFDRLRTPFMERLAAAGVEPGDVDVVVNTHLHVDHVGWNTRLVDGAWVPTFPRARYLLPRREVEARDPAGAARDRPAATHAPFLDSVRPILESGRATLLEGTEQVAAGVDLVPIPGHAPGQVAVRVRSDGEEAMFVADAMHQPVQVLRPEWNSRYCEDGAVARDTRRQILEYAAGHGTLLLPGHFGTPHCGRVERRGGGFRFAPSAVVP